MSHQIDAQINAWKNDLLLKCVPIDQIDYFLQEANNIRNTKKCDLDTMQEHIEYVYEDIIRNNFIPCNQNQKTDINFFSLINSNPPRLDVVSQSNKAASSCACLIKNCILCSSTKNKEFDNCELFYKIYSKLDHSVEELASFVRNKKINIPQLENKVRTLIKSDKSLLFVDSEARKEIESIEYKYSQLLLLSKLLILQKYISATKQEANLDTLGKTGMHLQMNASNIDCQEEMTALYFSGTQRNFSNQEEGDTPIVNVSQDDENNTNKKEIERGSLSRTQKNFKFHKNYNRPSTAKNLLNNTSVVTFHNKIRLSCNEHFIISSKNKFGNIFKQNHKVANKRPNEPENFDFLKKSAFISKSQQLNLNTQNASQIVLRKSTFYEGNILLLGAPKTGKSSFINLISVLEQNIPLLDIKEVKIQPYDHHLNGNSNLENFSKDATSTTQCSSIYCFTFKIHTIEYKINIIDTPGLSDIYIEDKYLLNVKNTINLIHQNQKENSFKLNAIFIFLNANECKLTNNLKEVLELIRILFPNIFQNNLFSVVTNSGHTFLEQKVQNLFKRNSCDIDLNNIFCINNDLFELKWKSNHQDYKIAQNSYQNLQNSLFQLFSSCCVSAQFCASNQENELEQFKRRIDLIRITKELQLMMQQKKKIELFKNKFLNEEFLYSRQILQKQIDDINQSSIIYTLEQTTEYNLICGVCLHNCYENFQSNAQGNLNFDEGNNLLLENLCQKCGEKQCSIKKHLYLKKRWVMIKTNEQIQNPQKTDSPSNSNIPSENNDQQLMLQQIWSSKLEKINRLIDTTYDSINLICNLNNNIEQLRIVEDLGELKQILIGRLNNCTINLKSNNLDQQIEKIIINCLLNYFQDYFNKLTPINLTKQLQNYAVLGELTQVIISQVNKKQFFNILILTTRNYNTNVFDSLQLWKITPFTL